MSTGKPKISPTAARLICDGLSGELAAIRADVERGHTRWLQSMSWRLVPEAGKPPLADANGHAALVSMSLAGAVEHLRQLDMALDRMRAAIPLEDPTAVPA